MIHGRGTARTKTRALTYGVGGGAMLTVSAPTRASAPTEQQPELKPERAEAKVYDPDTQTGLRCRASHQSLTPRPARPAPASPDDLLINMPIKVLFVLHQRKPPLEPSQVQGAHVSERHNCLRGASKKMSVPTGVRELRNAAKHCFRSCWRLGINAQQEVYIFNMRFKQ